MSYRKKRSLNQSDNNNQYESLFSAWFNNDLVNSSARRLGGNFYDPNTNLDGSVLSMKSISIKSHLQSHVDVDKIENQISNTPGNMNLGTISLTDMLKTNYSQKGPQNSVDQMASYEKITGVQQQHNIQNFELFDGLEEVSNRKLQNRVNSRRARLRKKEQWQQMKELIGDLQIQNRALKDTIQQSFGKKNQKKGYERKWRYCQRCQSQLFYDRQYGKSTQASLTQFFNDKSKTKIKSELQSEYLRIIGKREQNQEEQQMNHQKQQLMIKKDKHSTFQQEQMDVQFQQLDLKPKDNKTHNYDRKCKQRWIGKIWIALSVIMLVIGLQMNGLEGSGDKSIRLSEKEAKHWMSDLKDSEVSSLKIKMKTKVGSFPIQNEKDKGKEIRKSREKQRWYQKFQQNMKYHNEERSTEQNPWANISMEPEEMYTRELIEQQQTQLQISKDLLFSIHAQFDDIGRYI